MAATNGWVRTNINFDLPGRMFTVGARKLAALGFTQPDRDDPDKLSQWAIRVLGYFRPELDSPRTIIVAVGYSLTRMEWQVGVLHPSLPKTPQFQRWSTECLERCGACRKPLEDERFLRGQYEAQNGLKCFVQEEVCSKECAEARDTDTVTVVEPTDPFHHLRCEVCKDIVSSTRDREVWNTVNGVRHEWTERTCDNCCRLYAPG